jgi:hypothetical protein
MLCVVNLHAFLDKGAAVLIVEDPEAKVHLLAPLEAGIITSDGDVS